MSRLDDTAVVARPRRLGKRSAVPHAGTAERLPACLSPAKADGIDRAAGVIVGINAPQRVVVSRAAVPGARHVIAVLVANGPLAAPPAAASTCATPRSPSSLAAGRAAGKAASGAVNMARVRWGQARGLSSHCLAYAIDKGRDRPGGVPVARWGPR